MARIRRQNFPPQLVAHLADRDQLSEISSDDFLELRDRLDTNPEVPANDCFTRFDGFCVCGSGELIETILSEQQTPIGHEVS